MRTALYSVKTDIFGFLVLSFFLLFVNPDFSAIPVLTMGDAGCASTVSPKESTTEQAEKPFVAQKATYETEAQWQYRKKFIDYYQGKHSMDRLESWSKILSNSKFYGCTYLPDLMTKLNGMLVEMGEEPI